MVLRWSAPRPLDHQNDNDFDIFSTHFSASVLKHKNDSPKWSWKLPGEVKQRFWASEGSILRSIFESFCDMPEMEKSS